MASGEQLPGCAPQSRIRIGVPEPTLVQTTLARVLTVIPDVTVYRKVGSKSVRFTRSVKFNQPDKTKARYQVFLSDSTNDPAHGECRWVHWSLDVTSLKVDNLRDTFPDAEAVIEIEPWVLPFREGRLLGSAQLALTRHLLVAQYQQRFPGALIEGSGFDWDPSWWPDAPTYPTN